MLYLINYEFFSDEDETWSITDKVLQQDAENAMVRKYVTYINLRNIQNKVVNFYTCLEFLNGIRTEKTSGNLVFLTEPAGNFWTQIKSRISKADLKFKWTNIGVTQSEIVHRRVVLSKTYEMTLNVHNFVVHKMHEAISNFLDGCGRVVMCISVTDFSSDASCQSWIEKYQWDS